MNEILTYPLPEFLVQEYPLPPTKLGDLPKLVRNTLRVAVRHTNTMATMGSLDITLPNCTSAMNRFACMAGDRLLDPQGIVDTVGKRYTFLEGTLIRIAQSLDEALRKMLEVDHGGAPPALRTELLAFTESILQAVQQLPYYLAVETQPASDNRRPYIWQWWRADFTVWTRTTRRPVVIEPSKDPILPARDHPNSQPLRLVTDAARANMQRVGRHFGLPWWAEQLMLPRLFTDTDVELIAGMLGTAQSREAA